MAAAGGDAGERGVVGKGEMGTHAGAHLEVM